MNNEQKKQFNSIFEELSKALDITETQYNNAVNSYNAVGEWLSEGNSPLSAYDVEILPQGSFMLGTMIRPINDDDDLDIDLVCQLRGKNVSWTQKDVKSIVGNRIKQNNQYKGMIKHPEGRRCWTLLYRENSKNSQEKYHMDILPCVVDKNYHLLLENAFSNNLDYKQLTSLSIRITDKESNDYETETNHLNWLKSNPFGYARWFFDRCNQISQTKYFSLNESIQPVKKYSTSKSPLQRIVQILKRHRDIMFDGDEDKPISIIITTLAAKAYSGEANIVDGLINVVNNLENGIEVIDGVNVVKNPVNFAENFADKWVENPKKKENFIKWMKQMKNDIDEIVTSSNIFEVQKCFSNHYGENIVNEAFDNYAKQIKIQRDSNNLKVAPNGILGTIGTTVKEHNFYGE